MRSHGLVSVTVEQQQQQQPPPQAVASAATADAVPPAEEGVDSVGPSLCMPNGKPVSPSALPPGPSRAALQKAILTQDSERFEHMHIEIHFKKTVEEMPLLDHGFIVNANIFQARRPSSRLIPEIPLCTLKCHS